MKLTNILKIGDVTGMLYLCMAVCILFSIVTIYMAVPAENAFRKDSDEGCYFRYTDNIVKDGVKGLLSSLKWYCDEETEHSHPNPLRVGYLFFTVLWFKIFGASFGFLAKFSFFCYILFLIVSFYYTRKFFGINIAFPFVLLLSSSPLIAGMSTRALSDSCGNLALCLTVWFFLDFLTSRSNIKFIIFLLLFYICITIRESSAILLLFFVIFFLLHKYWYKRSISNTYLLGIIFVPFFMTGISYIVLSGGTNNVMFLIKALQETYFNSGYSLYNISFSSGPWYRYIIDYMLLSPFTVFLFLGYVFYILFSRKFEYKTFYFLIYFVIIYIILGSLPHSKNVRHVINLDMVINLFSVFALYELFRQKNKIYQNYMVFIFSIAIFFINYFSFVDFFIFKDIYDPISYLLLKARGFIP